MRKLGQLPPPRPDQDDLPVRPAAVLREGTDKPRRLAFEGHLSANDRLEHVQVRSLLPGGVWLQMCKSAMHKFAHGGA